MAHHHHDLHHHDHSHHHHHSHAHGITSVNGILIFSIVLNLLFVAVEVVVGLTHHSLSLLSDAGHNLSDVFSLVLVAIGFRLARVVSNKTYTYGYKKSTVLISLLNAIILLVAVGAIIVESVNKICEPQEVNGMAVSWTAGVGIVINGLTALLLMRGQKTDINVRGAFLHMVADTLVSLGVVVSGLLISATGWYITDPLVSIAIALLILVSTWRLLVESLKLTLDGTPEGISTDDITDAIAAVDNVRGVHHVHVWAISTTTNALTAHVVIGDVGSMGKTKHDIKEMLKTKNISHSTIEFETLDDHCHDHLHHESVKCDCK